MWRMGIKREVPFPPKLPDIPLYLVKIEKIGAKSVFMFTLIKRNADCEMWSGLRFAVGAVLRWIAVECSPMLCALRSIGND